MINPPTSPPPPEPPSASPPPVEPPPVPEPSPSSPPSWGPTSVWDHLFALLGSAVAIAVALVDLRTGQVLGKALDLTLLFGGLAGLGFKWLGRNS